MHTRNDETIIDYVHRIYIYFLALPIDHPYTLHKHIHCSAQITMDHCLRNIWLRDFVTLFFETRIYYRRGTNGYSTEFWEFNIEQYLFYLKLKKARNKNCRNKMKCKQKPKKKKKKKPATKPRWKKKFSIKFKHCFSCFFSFFLFFLLFEKWSLMYGSNHQRKWYRIKCETLSNGIGWTVVVLAI